MSRAKGITPVISTIVLLLITVALAGSAWLYLSGYMEAFTYKTIDIPTGSVYFDGSNMQLLVRNMGTSTISTSPCSTSGNTVTCGDITITREGGGSNPDIRPENASISPGSVVKFRDYNCLAGRIRYVISSPSSTRYIDVNADNNCAGAPAPVCGNSIRESNSTVTETCDGTDLGGETCITLGYSSGNLTCSPDCSSFNTSSCAGPEPCGNSICSPGENCPRDNTSCSDNICYEPTCINGCGQTLVAQGGNDIGCLSPMMCDGSGSCVECIVNRDCTSGKICQAGVCVPGFCTGVSQCANYTDQGNCTTNPCGVGEVCEWNATFGVCEEAPGECLIDSDCASRGPGFICNSSNICEWKPPIGIPKPTFGIEETYRMYDDESNRNPALNYTQNAEGGYYTHYVDNTHPNATDNGNTFGTAERPRLTIPANLGDGSVVEVHGGGYGTNNLMLLVVGNGTEEKPVFIRGASVAERPTVTGLFYPQGSYIIVENLYLYHTSLIFIIQSGAPGPIHHIAIRNSEFEQSGVWTKRDAISVHTYDVDDPHDIVIYNNHIHHYGDYLSKTENDAHGIGVSTSHNVWVVDNHIHHNGGDSIQVQSKFAKYIYIGRNLMHENREQAVDIKQSEHVIISENEMYGFVPVTTAAGDAVAVHYDPTLNIWIINNHIYNSVVGISSSTGPTTIYIIGNIIHSINTSAITFWNNGKVYAVSNTIYDAGGGISGSTSTALYAFNNIIANLNLSSYNSVHLGVWSAAMAGASNASYNLFYQEGGSVRINWRGGSGDYYDFSGFKSAYPDKCEGCIEADPQFTNPSANDFNLQPTSPAIDNGTASDVYQTFFDLYGIDIRKDIEGNPRPQGTGWDIGAYESSYTKPCPGGLDSECDDSNPCTNDVCNASLFCEHTFNTNPCNDGNECTENDACSLGSCAGTPKTNGTSCTGDGLFCTGAETCQSGSCASSGTSCTDDGIACTILCDEATDSCNIPDDSFCDDGNPCTNNTCNPVLGCITENLTGPSCDDGIFCTENDVCSGGICTGTANNAKCLIGYPNCTSATCDINLGCINYIPAGCIPSLPTGYVSWWRFEGNANDETGANSGTINGDPQFVSGQFGQALDFDGNGDYVTLSYYDVGPALTYSLWYKPSANLNAQGLLSFMKTLIRVDVEGDTLYWYPTIDGGYEFISAIFNVGTWYHIAITQTGSSYAMYVNGVSLKTGSANAIDRTGMNKYIATYTPTTWNTNGTIDEVMIYNRSLNLTEIQQIYCGQGGTGTFC